MTPQNAHNRHVPCLTSALHVQSDLEEPQRPKDRRIIRNRGSMELTATPAPALYRIHPGLSCQIAILARPLDTSGPSQRPRRGLCDGVKV